VEDLELTLGSGIVWPAHPLDLEDEPGTEHKTLYLGAAGTLWAMWYLEQKGAVELRVAPTAEIAIEMALVERPRLVIMDINLPGMSGFEAARQLQAWPDTQHIPIVGLSAAALLKDTKRANEAGFYRYLTKPVKVADLTATLEELLVRCR